MNKLKELENKYTGKTILFYADYVDEWDKEILTKIDIHPDGIKDGVVFLTKTDRWFDIEYVIDYFERSK